MSNRKWGGIPAPVALITFIIGIVAIVGAAVFVLKPELFKRLKGDNVQASAAIPFAARVDRLDGDIGIARQTGSPDQPYQGWTEATVNSPVSLGDRIHVNERSKAAVAFSTRNYARLNPNTSIDVVSLTPRQTQLALREGAGVFDIGALAPDEVFEIGTPNGAVDFTEPGLYQVGIDDGGDTVVSVLNGTAHCVGDSGSADISKGQLLTLTASEVAQAIVSELSPTVAGSIVDDYYAFRYPDDYDHRYADYRVYEEDPYYYDQTYRRSASYQYIPEEDDIAGLEDLDDYGDWVDVPNYGHCWRPRNVSDDWAPYRDGYWSNENTVGLTWVSSERWGWAPYHYGRWAHVNSNWFWVPTDAVRQPVYAPALVAFVSLARADEIGWVPLGPGDPYVPRYYDQDYRPHYVGSRDSVDRYVNYTNLVNYNVPAAVTVVNVTQFTQVITPRVVLRPDATYLASARPVLDPLAVPVVRQLAPTIEAARPAVSVPVEVQQVMSRPIMFRQPTAVPPVATNVAGSLKVQQIPEEKAKRKLQVKNIDQPVVATNPTGLPEVTPQAKLNQMSDQERQARIAALQAQANQGSKAARRELRQLEEQQQQQAAQQAVAQQQQQVEQRKAEKQAAREQAQQAEQQRQVQAAQEAEQRKAQKQAARQQAQQAEQRRQQQLAQETEQRKAQKQAARQQAQKAEQERQAPAAQQGEQRKAEKRAARQQQQAGQTEQQRQQQAAQQAEQRKAEKQAARQQAQQAEQQRQQWAAQQAAQQAEQRKAEKRAQQLQAQQAEQQRQQQAAQQAEQRKVEKRAALQQQAQQAEQQRQQQAAHEAELRTAQKRAAQEQAQQEAARQQAQQEQRRVQKQAQQQAQQEEQQRQQQKAEKRAQRQQAEQPPQPQAQQQEQQQRQRQKAEKRAQRQQAEQQQSQPEANPNKAERKKNKNKNEN